MLVSSTRITISFYSKREQIGREVLVRWNRDISREMLDAPPHLLVVGDRNPLDYWPGAAQARGQAGGTAAVAARSEERSYCIRRHMCFLTPPGLRGTRSQKCARS